MIPLDRDMLHAFTSRDIVFGCMTVKAQIRRGHSPKVAEENNENLPQGLYVTIVETQII